MARTELPNGVILPAEYSDDWYEDMTSNLTKLDDVIGSDSEKLNSNDVAFLRMSSAALTDGGTGNFSDLNSSNKLKTGDYVLDSGRKLYQVVSVDSTNETFTVGNSLFKITAESDLAPVAESGDYDDLDNKPDLNPYDQHIVNTDIHVTTADKNKWNNGVTQSYVFRYSGTAVVPNSTIAYSTIDNTDNIKSGDKILDVDGKLFEITAVDTTNQTVTVGTALIDLALDANVVHTSGDETINGVKSFINYFLGKDLSGQTVDLNDCVDAYGGAIHYYYAVSNYTNISNKPENKPFILESKTVRYVSSIDYTYYQKIYTADYNTAPSIYTRYYRSGSASWSNWVKDTDKFVTTDTAQTITEIKTFANTIKSKKEIELTGSRLAYILPEFSAGYSGLSLCTYGSNGAVKLGTWKVDDNDNTKHVLDSSLGYLSVSTGSSNSVNIVYLTPRNATTSKLGDSTNKWKEINGITPSSLGMPVAPSSTSYVDISGYITVLDGSTPNTYTPPSNGYITFSVTGNLVQIFHDYGLQGKWFVQAGNANRGFIPVLGSVEVKIYVTASNIDKFWFIPCQGNI